MKRVVETHFDAYSASPRWTLTLSCGHTAEFRAEKDWATAKPPETVECQLCAQKEKATTMKEGSQAPAESGAKKKPNGKTVVAVGTVAMFSCQLHVCVGFAGRRSVFYPVEGKTVADGTQPLGYRSLGETVLEGKQISDSLLSDPLSHERFADKTEQQVRELLAGNAVPAEEAEQDGEKKDQTMKKKTKSAGRKLSPKKEAANGNGTERHSGKLGELFGHSVTSVVRRMGVLGLNAKQATKALKAFKLEASPNTVNIQLGWGRNGVKPAAELTKAQCEELVAAGGEKEPKPEKADKK